MQDGVDRTFQEERLTDVVADELERSVVTEVRNVLCLARYQVVDADDLPAIGEQPVAEVRPKEARAAGHDRPAAPPPPPPRGGGERACPSVGGRAALDPGPVARCSWGGEPGGAVRHR